jgi:hypothetical protein
MTRKRNRPVSRPAGKKVGSVRSSGVRSTARPASGPNKARLREMRERLMAQRSAKGSPRRKAMESRMSRAGFLQTAGVAGAGLGAAAMGMSGVAHAAGGTTTVTGEDDPGIDVPAVQNAVDTFEKVTLQGTFDFGNDSVVIKSDVIVRGDGATIKGGVGTIRVYDEVDASIMGIHFVEPILSGVVVSAANEVTVKDNTFTGTQSALVAPGYISWPIMVGEWNYAFFNDDLPGEYSPGQIPPAGSTAEFINDIEEIQPAAVKSVLKVNITNNTVIQTESNANHAACIALWEILEEPSKEKYYIFENNYLDNQSSVFSPGIWITGCGGAKCNVRNNKISNAISGIQLYGHYFYDHCGSDHIVSNNIIDSHNVGIEFSAVLNSVIQRNKINILSGVGMYIWAGYTTGSNGNYIAKNILSGTTDFGIYVGDFPGWPPSSNNVIMSNNLRGLDLVPGFSSHAVFLPQSEYNVFLGHKDDTVMDFGNNNHVILGKKISKELKTDIKSIHTEYKEKVQELKDQWLANK